MPTVHECVYRVYLARLEVLHIESLEERQLRSDMICMYKLFNSLFNLNSNYFFVKSSTVTRGHVFKVCKPYCKHSYAQHFFCYRPIDLWNSLPINVVCATSLNVFKCKLSEVNIFNYCKGRAFV